jgi:hypothetical protein
VARRAEQSGFAQPVTEDSLLASGAPWRRPCGRVLSTLGVAGGGRRRPSLGCTLENPRARLQFGSALPRGVPAASLRRRRRGPSRNSQAQGRR